MSGFVPLSTNPPPSPFLGRPLCMAPSQVAAPGASPSSRQVKWYRLRGGHLATALPNSSQLTLIPFIRINSYIYLDIG